jgi:hypothetical protein
VRHDTTRCMLPCRFYGHEHSWLLSASWSYHVLSSASLHYKVPSTTQCPFTRHLGLLHVSSLRGHTIGSCMSQCAQIAASMPYKTLSTATHEAEECSWFLYPAAAADASEP